MILTKISRRAWSASLAMALLMAFMIAPAGPAQAAVEPILVSPVDLYPSAAPKVCRSSAYEGVKAFARILESSFGPNAAPAARACPTSGTFMSYHSRGLAHDYFVDATKASDSLEAQLIFDWLFEGNPAGESHVRLRRLGVLEIIWNNKIWTTFQRGATSDITTWRDHDSTACVDRGGAKASCEHTDHIHFSFSLEGGKQQTTWWTRELAPYRDTPTSPAVIFPLPAFDPALSVTVGAMAQWLFNVARWPAVAGTFAANDASRPMAWLAESGITGFESDQDVSAVVSRSEFARVLYEYDGLDGLRAEPQAELSDFTFVDVDESQTEILWLARAGVGSNFESDGEGNYYYRPDDEISRQDAALYFYGLALMPHVPEPVFEPYSDAFDAPYAEAVGWMWAEHIDRQRFGDVASSHPFFSEIHWMASTGVTTGFAGGLWAPNTFEPRAAVTRQAMAAFLYRFAVADAVPPTVASFSDVSVGHVFFAEIEWLVGSGVATGYEDGTYQPGANVSREAMAAFVYRMAGSPALEAPSEPTFSDVGTAHPFFMEIEWLAAEGLTTGYSDGTFRPSGTISREAMSAFLFRFASRDVA